MTATDELRRLLAERGVKWWPMRNNGYYEDRDTEFVANGKKHTAHEWGDGFAVYSLTPEQAIAATLGNELNPDGLPVGLTISEDGELLNWLGENYVKQSTQGSGECELVYGENDHGDDGWWCQSCGEWFAASFRHTGRNNIIEPSYCQHCGKAVKR